MNILHNKPLLKDVCLFLDSKSCYWDEIGRELGVFRIDRMMVSTNMNIKKATQKLEAVLDLWLQQRGDSCICTWDQLMKGLLRLGFTDSVKRILTHIGKDEIFIGKYSKYNTCILCV